MTYFTQSSATYGGNYQAILTPNFGTNTDIVLQHNGNTCLQRNTPNGSASAGNPRASYTTDLQSARAAATQIASGDYSTLTGGRNNTASGTGSVVVGGLSNTASGTGSVVGGGYTNTASGNNSCVVGGYNNTASGLCSCVGGGTDGTYGNSATSEYSFVGGGANNTASGNGFNCIGGGYGNSITNTSNYLCEYNTCWGGRLNSIIANNSAIASAICGGDSNAIYDNMCSIGGGTSNVIYSSYGGSTAINGSTIAGGSNNAIGGNGQTPGYGIACSVSGGTNNIISASGGASNSAIAGGQYNVIGNNICSYIGGGSYNTITQDYSATLGGYILKLTSAPYSTACGQYNTDGTFTYGYTSGTRQFMVGYGTSRTSTLNLASVVNVTAGVTGGYIVADAGYAVSAGADFGEMYESLSGKAIPVGTPVAFQPGTNKIIPVTSNINPALSGKKLLPIGVISNTCAYINNACMEYWHGRFERDADGNMTLIEVVDEYEVPPDIITVEKEIREEVFEDKEIMEQTRTVIVDPETNITTIKITQTPKTIKVPVMEEWDVMDGDKVVGKEKVQRTITKLAQVKVQGPPTTRKIVKKVPKESDNYRKDEKYIPRLFREEWNVVGLLGEVKVLRGRPVHPNWIKLKTGPKYDTYFIRA